MLSSTGRQGSMDYHAAVNWLLSSDEPAVRFLTRRDVLGEPICEDVGDALEGRKDRHGP
jgi:hypothetical protein